MTILNKIKKGLIVIGTFLLTAPTKVFAKPINPTIKVLYDPPETVAMYGVEKPPMFIEKIWNPTKIIIIPVILLIGIIIYFRKSKSSRRRKIITAIFIIVLNIILCITIDKIIRLM